MHVRFEAGGLRSDSGAPAGDLDGGRGHGRRDPLPRAPARGCSSSTSARIASGSDAQRPCPVGRAVLAPALRRWLLPGERVRLSAEAWLWVEAAVEVPATLALVRSLLAPGAAALSVGPLLACVAGRDAGKVFPLVDPVTEIGRLPGCAVQLGDGAVSRRHLQLVGEHGAHRVRDIGGRNRARCNGRGSARGEAPCSPRVISSRSAARCCTIGRSPRAAAHRIGDSPARSTSSSIRRRCWAKKLVKCIPRPRPRTAYTVTGPGRMSTFRMSRKAK